MDPDHLVLRPRKMRSGQRFSYLALEPEETRALNAAYHERIHRDQSNLIPLGSRSFHPKRLSNSWPATATSKKAWAWMALTGRRPAEIFFSATFSLPREKLPYPAILFDGQLKTRQAPGTSFELYLIPVLADPRKLVQALDRLRSLKSFPSTKAVNTTTRPTTPQVRFRSLRLPRPTLWPTLTLNPPRNSPTQPKGIMDTAKAQKRGKRLRDPRERAFLGSEILAK